MTETKDQEKDTAALARMLAGGAEGEVMRWRQTLREATKSGRLAARMQPHIIPIRNSLRTFSPGSIAFITRHALAAWLREYLPDYVPNIHVKCWLGDAWTETPAVPPATAMTEYKDRIDMDELAWLMGSRDKTKKQRWQQIVEAAIGNGTLNVVTRETVGEESTYSEYKVRRSDGRRQTLFKTETGTKPTYSKTITANRADVEAWLPILNDPSQPTTELRQWLDDPRYASLTSTPAKSVSAAVQESSPQENIRHGDEDTDIWEKRIKTLVALITHVFELDPKKVPRGAKIDMEAYCFRHRPQIFTTSTFNRVWSMARSKGYDERIAEDFSGPPYHPKCERLLLEAEQALLSTREHQ